MSKKDYTKALARNHVNARIRTIRTMERDGEKVEVPFYDLYLQPRRI